MNFLFGLLLAPSSAGFVPPPLPVIDTVGARASGGPSLAGWAPGPVTCNDGTPVDTAGLVHPLKGLWRDSMARGGVTLRFDIDASGRAISIEDRYSPGTDLGPALAASHFPAAAREGCSITFTPKEIPIAAATIADLAAYTMDPISGRLPGQGWSRLWGEGDCMERPRPQVLTRAYPDFRKVPAKPGVREWALVSYDLDANGKSVHARIMTGSGNQALEKESVKAVARSRFTGGARQACRFPYWLKPATVPAPPMPGPGDQPKNASCPAEKQWAVPPSLRFPPAYGRRRIEGWAIVAYDVAPWGAIGNARVVQTQPSDAFGRQALQMLQQAKLASSPQGATGCVARVRFAMEPQAGSRTDADAVEPETEF
ncbi:energy transducer TonB [Novosphingobium aerophilum]|uniref:energy transducer TonB n=1 Tax=Novosphingobium TaxID=165696 RepID=UPI002D79A044|nr:TonB family protein [Novosphingobium sp. RL4]WRT94245.1 TonB family protein [Novosphingobium sp. RL4]